MCESIMGLVIGRRESVHWLTPTVRAELKLHPPYGHRACKW